jgi:hypothetical protein
MNTVELWLGLLDLCLLLRDNRRKETCLLVELLSKRINIIEEALVLAHKAWRTLRCSDEVIAIARDHVIVGTGSGLVRWRGHGLSSCVYIYGIVLRKIGGVAEGVGVVGRYGGLPTASIGKCVK